MLRYRPTPPSTAPCGAAWSQVCLVIFSPLSFFSPAPCPFSACRLFLVVPSFLIKITSRSCAGKFVSVNNRHSPVNSGGGRLYTGMFFQPVYSFGVTPGTMQERRTSCIGGAVGEVKYYRFVEGVEGRSGQSLGCLLFDPDSPYGLPLFCCGMPSLHFPSLSAALACTQASGC